MAGHGDIVRKWWPVEPSKRLNLYVGTGRCGGCFDAYGLQHPAKDEYSPIRISQTWLSHAEVWHRGLYGLDSLVPVGRVYWEHPPQEISEYHQHLDISCGMLTTEYAGPGMQIRLRVLSNPDAEFRDCLVWLLEWNAQHPLKLVVDTPVFFETTYHEELIAETAVDVGERAACLRVKRGSSLGVVCLGWTDDLSAKPSNHGILLALKPGRGAATLAVSLGPETRKHELMERSSKYSAYPAHELERLARSAWSTRWGTVSLPEIQGPVGKLLRRSMYHILASYAPDVRAPAPPMGFTGNNWGFHFPQDLSFIHPALIRFGHLDIVQAHVEFYRSCLDDQLRLTREIYKRPGICWSWEFPIGPGARLFDEATGGVPNDFQFQIHNAAYPAKMAAEAAAHLPMTWASDVAWPILRESARFYASGAVREQDGKYSIDIQPAMGQDEYGERDARNYLCALFSADYTLRAAVDLAERLGLSDEDIASWKRIIRNGFAYKRLIWKEWDVYATHEGAPPGLNMEKHPVQLGPLFQFPSLKADAHTKRAYEMRRVICRVEREEHRHPGVPTGFYDGWTLFAFMLSAVRMKDAPGFAHELSELVPSRSVDPEWITPYESSGFWQPYYTASMGLFVQAVCEAADLGWQAAFDG